jgi:antitoxin CcdA
LALHTHATDQHQLAIMNKVSTVFGNAHLWHHPRCTYERIFIMTTILRNQATAAKRATNVSLAVNLLAEAKALHINVSQAAEAGVAKAVAEKRAESWLKDNAKAFDCWNAYIEKNGLPLEKYRSF